MPAPEVCPNCGALVPRRARSCPECGSDEQTGWADDAVAQRLGIPDDSFDHDQFVREEFGEEGKRRVRAPGGSWLWWGVAVLLLVVFLWRILG